MASYKILPFNFKYINPDELLLVNDSGDYQFLNEQQFNDLLGFKLLPKTHLYQTLVSNHFIADSDVDLTIELIATKYRTRKGFLRNFTALHMMVITVRCNHRCSYCQVSSESENAHKFDMTPEMAKNVVNFIFQSPGKDIKIEFQGGEPLLNWKAITSAIEHAEKLNKTFNKNLSFVVCTNLTLITKDQLNYLLDHQVLLSTSLDGCKEIHDANRILRIGGSSYEKYLEKLEIARKICGEDSVAALMATTKQNLWHLDKVVDEYVKRGFPGIFFRPLNPYGFAAENVEKLGYPLEDFVTAFSQGLEYILNLNLNGQPIQEYYTTILLTRILTSWPTGFVDLQSPAGTGICGVIYDYNGDIYPADEARMLARMGDKHFLMGNVEKHSYNDVFLGDTLSEIVKGSCVETMPGCATCVYQAYCGADPIRNYLESGDIVGHRPTSGFCKKHMGIFDFLFKKLRNATQDDLDIFWSWITRRKLEEITL